MKAYKFMIYLMERVLLEIVNEIYLKCGIQVYSAFESSAAALRRLFDK